MSCTCDMCMCVQVGASSPISPLHLPCISPMSVRVQVGASSDAIAAFLSGVVGQYEAGAVIEALRQQAAEVRARWVP